MLVKIFKSTDFEVNIICNFRALFVIMKKILEDIKILDFTHVWFGPYSTMMLAELGAEVTKVEPPWGTIGRL